jgi:hypothetical protein
MKSVQTIDEKHTEILQQFHINNEQTIPKLKEEIQQLKDKIKTLKSHQLDEYMDIKDK